jgi:signal transduction histidine kinase
MALLYTSLADRISGLVARNLLMSRASPPTMRRIRDALADVLDDPALEVYYRLPHSDHYADHQGHCAGTFSQADLTWDQQASRWLHPVFTGRGVIAALLDLDVRLRERRSLLDAAGSVSRLLLMHADLQDELKAASTRLQRQAQAGILQAGLTERRRIERDLHDGAQQMLLALSMKMGATIASATERQVRELVRSWQQDLRSISDELRNLARGIYPATLSERGLRAALESLAERQADLHVTIDVPEARFPGIHETNLYFSIAEAVTNASKHAQASKVRVEIMHTPPFLTCSVTDNGNGQAAVLPGGGLEGLINRLRVLGGDVCVAATLGEGSVIEMMLPCE